MFSVIIPITNLTKFVLNNARIFVQTPAIKQVILLNYSNKTLTMGDNIKKTSIVHINDTVYNSISKALSEHVNQKNTIILDSNIQVGSKFSAKLITHYANKHLYTFKVNEVSSNNTVRVDNRTGNRISPESFHTCAVAFQTDMALNIGGFKDGDLIDFAFRMKNSGNILKLLPQVLCHKIEDETNNIIVDDKPRNYHPPSPESLNTVTSPTLPIPLVREESLAVNFKHSADRKYSIIIPFMYKGDRFPLFEATIERLHQFIKNDPNIELIIHETDTKQKLTQKFIDRYNIKYMFSQWNEVFHRGWALNVPARHLATGDVYVFMDADLLVTHDWYKEIKMFHSGVGFGWGTMKNINKVETDRYLKTKQEPQRFSRTRRPAVVAAAGGVTIISKDIFDKVEGWPEDFRGTYGGEDNAMFLKLRHLHPKRIKFTSTLIHMHHSHMTKRNPMRFAIYNTMKKWKMGDWKKHVSQMTDWGKRGYDSIIIDKSEKSVVVPSDKLKILWLAIDRGYRVANHFDDFRYAVSKVADVTTLKHESYGVLPNQLYNEFQSGKRLYPNIVKKHLNDHSQYDFIVCDAMFVYMKEDWKSIKIPTAIIIEDQQRDVPKAQIDFAISNNFTIIHRYQFNQFHTDLAKKKMSTIWSPHSVNEESFKDHMLPKTYDLLQTGAIGGVYKTRSLVYDTLKDEPYYNRILRPAEKDKVQWPTGIDYARELNKAMMSVCCGSDLQFPVMKHFEIPACRSVLYCDYFPELGDLGFTPDVNMVTVDRKNIKKQVESLLLDIPKLNVISNRGLDLIKTRHTNNTRAMELVKELRSKI